MKRYDQPELTSIHGIQMAIVSRGAVWIGSSHPFDLHEAYLCFRSPSDWYLDSLPKETELLITADSRYRLWVNGHAVARGPARCYPHAQSVDILDIAPYLQVGPNLLAIQVYQPGYSHFAYVHRANAGLLAVLDCCGWDEFVTSTAWRVRRDRSYNDRVPRMSIYQAGVEDRDLSLADDWTRPGYDDSSWPTARMVARVGDMPWTGLVERVLPLVVEREVPMKQLRARRGPYPAAQVCDPHQALRESWAAGAEIPQRIEETESEKRSASDADDEGWRAVSLASGEACTWVFDLGRGYTCLGQVEIQGAQGGEHLVISYSEKLQGDEPYLSDPETYCRVRMTDRYRLAAGNQHIEPFWMRGGRILLFQVVGPTGPTFRVRFGARAAEYPLEVTRPLSSDDPLLAGIIRLCENTLRSCLHETFVDNPWRENAQWIGDPTVNALVMSAISDDTRPWDWWIEEYKNRDYPLAVGGYPCGFFGTLVHLIGYQNVFYKYYDEPDLLKDILGHLTTLWISIWEEILADVEIDCCHIWEDMSSTMGVMISPAHFAEFMAPCYRRISDFLKGHGVNTLLVDTDGNIEQLIPQFLEAGVTGMYPMETSAGMDVMKLRKQYPRFQMMGGVPKYDMALGPARIEEFLQPVNELLKYGGYVPTGDHCISPGVSWENFKYYRRRLNEIIDANGAV